MTTSDVRGAGVELAVESLQPGLAAFRLVTQAVERERELDLDAALARFQHEPQIGAGEPRSRSSNMSGGRRLRRPAADGAGRDRRRRLVGPARRGVEEAAERLLREVPRVETEFDRRIGEILQRVRRADRRNGDGELHVDMLAFVAARVRDDGVRRGQDRLPALGHRYRRRRRAILSGSSGARWFPANLRP